MKLHFQKFFPVLLTLVLLLIPLCAYAVEEEAVPAETLPELVLEEIADPQPDPAPEISLEVSYQERLEEIQVLLMYICGIGIFWTFVECGKLLYRFFNMFF